MDIQESKNFAKDRIKALEEEIPLRIKRKEENLFNRLSNAKLKPIKKLASLYDAMNEIYGFAAKFTPCKKGCSKCCYYNVTVSEIEVQYIELNEGIKRDKVLGNKRDFHGERCPFLGKSGSCEIYNSRPFVCRRHVVVTEDSTWCETDKANKHTFPLLAFSEVDKSFDLIRVEAGCEKSQTDLRQLFNSKL